jgi:hypothetical protein
MLSAMRSHSGLIQPASPFNQPQDYLRNVASAQQRRGGNQFSVNAKRRHNARIDPPPDATTQRDRNHRTMMKGKLRAVGLNELLGCPARIIQQSGD